MQPWGFYSALLLCTDSNRLSGLRHETRHMTGPSKKKCESYEVSAAKLCEKKNRLWQNSTAHSAVFKLFSQSLVLKTAWKRSSVTRVGKKDVRNELCSAYASRQLASQLTWVQLEPRVNCLSDNEQMGGSKQHHNFFFSERLLNF